MNKHPKTTIMCAGGVHQLEAVESSTYTRINGEYLTLGVNMVFPSTIKLIESERIKDPPQVPTAKDMYDGILHINIKIDNRIGTYNLKELNHKQYTELIYNESNCCT